jgi:hypothetical protein
MMEERWIGSRWDRSPLVNTGMSGHPWYHVQFGSRWDPSSSTLSLHLLPKTSKAFSESFPDKYPDFFYDFPTENPIGFFFIFPVGFFRGFRRGLQRLASPPSL